MSPFHAFAITIAGVLLAAGPASARSPGPAEARIYTCDTTANPASLQFEDRSSIDGAIIEHPRLITLPNGMKAVTFGLRYADRLRSSGRILKFRYSVNWTDSCGRPVAVGQLQTDGLALNPGQYQTLKSTALHPDATHAALRTYVE